MLVRWIGQCLVLSWIETLNHLDSDKDCRVECDLLGRLMSAIPNTEPIRYPSNNRSAGQRGGTSEERFNIKQVIFELIWAKMEIIWKVWSKNLKTSSKSTHETQYNNVKGYQVNITRIDAFWRSHNQIIICTMKYWTNTHSWRLRKHIKWPSRNNLYNSSTNRKSKTKTRRIKFTELSWSRNIDFVLVFISVQFHLDLLF